MAEPDEDTPDYWNELALEIFDELKPDVDAILDTMTQGGIAPGEVLPTMPMLRRLTFDKAMTAIDAMIANPRHQTKGLQLFTRYLQELERASLRGQDQAIGVAQA